jgi:hypothetical protein
MLSISFSDLVIIFCFMLNLFLIFLIFFPIGSAEANGNPEVYEVNFMLNQGPNDLIWGAASPGATVTVERNSLQLFTAYADPACSGCWEADMPYEFSCGDEVTIVAGTGSYPVSVTIPNPLDTNVDTTLDRVWGQIGDYPSSHVEIFGEWEDGYQEISTDPAGNFSVFYPDIPRGGSGLIFFAKEEESATVNFHVQFRSLDLVLEVNYLHDWVQGYYEPDHTVWITLFDADGVTTKGSVEVISGPMQGTNETGFFTLNATWLPAQPDIVPGDWVFASSDTGAQTWVSIGTISGEVDITADNNYGKVDVPWLPQEDAINVVCAPWDAPYEMDTKLSTVLPDGIDEYLCDWQYEWDILPNERIAVAYQDPGGYPNPDGSTNAGANLIYNVFNGYLDELIMNIHYGYDWIEGLYEPGHEIMITVKDGAEVVKGEITIDTGEIDAWDKRSGFATWLDDEEWLPERPDIQPGDIIQGEVDDGTQFWMMVKIGEITGEVDVLSDSISGTIWGSWLMPGPIDVACSIWEEIEPESKFDTVIPDGEDSYTCSWDTWDIQIGDTVQVAYNDINGHKIINNFLEPITLHLPIIFK